MVCMVALRSCAVFLGPAEVRFTCSFRFNPFFRFRPSSCIAARSAWFMVRPYFCIVCIDVKVQRRWRGIWNEWGVSNRGKRRIIEKVEESNILLLLNTFAAKNVSIDCDGLLDFRAWCAAAASPSSSVRYAASSGILPSSFAAGKLVSPFGVLLSVS